VFMQNESQKRLVFLYTSFKSNCSDTLFYFDFVTCFVGSVIIMRGFTQFGVYFYLLLNSL
jgi:hypothetical protein